MSGREWKPGDVAMVQMGHGPQVAIWTGEFWAWSNGSGPYDGVSHCHHSAPARPLVVIDPEDREQVALLIRALVRSTSDPGVRAYLPDIAFSDVQAALREFADPKPPKPEEPTGLGAVVEDAEGNRWARARLLPDEDLGAEWVGGIPARWAHYADIKAVEVIKWGDA